jgi:hypothetical protein
MVKINSKNVKDYIQGTEVHLWQRGVEAIAADTFRGLTHITSMYISDVCTLTCILEVWTIIS